MAISMVANPSTYTASACMITRHGIKWTVTSNEELFMSLKWIPNAVTIVRIAAAPVVTYLLVSMFTAEDTVLKEFYAGSAFTVFTLAAITDWFDGFLARKLDAASDLGAKLDLWADKIIVLAVLLGSVAFLPMLAWVGLISLSLRDIVIMRLRAVRPDVNLKATFLAKSKTAVVMAGMATAMIGYAFMLAALRVDDSSGAHAMNLIMRLGLCAYVFGCVLSLGTGYQYIQAAVGQRPDSDE